VGSGPSGLTVAGDLVKLGYEVTVFEGLHEFGGVLTYGIPEFRLPKMVVKVEIDYIRRLGVDFQNDVIIGRTFTIDELFHQGYRAVFVGTGAGPPIFLNIPGEFLNGVYTSNEFLTRCNLMHAYRTNEYDTPLFVGKKAVVIGGGNVAVDAARVALRSKAQDVSILYRRSRNEMPARIEEIENAEEEGIKMNFLKTPIEFKGLNGWVKSIECLKMKLSSFDASGRLRPIPIPDSNHILKADMVIISIGRKPNPTIPQTTIGLKTNGGRILVDAYGRTTIPKVWAGGDVVTGESTVIQAIGAGKIAANDIHEYLKNSQIKQYTG
jgi:glutamate synthase (NADPH/NADH) small chain